MAKDLNPDFDLRTSYSVDIGKLQKGLKGSCGKCGCVFETDGDEKVIRVANSALDRDGCQGWVIPCPRCKADGFVVSPKQYRVAYDDDGSGNFQIVRRGGNAECFIATACFNDGSAPEVCTLRIWRDTVLKNSRIGRCAVLIYYGGTGQIGAKILNIFPFLKPTVRRLLKTLIKNVSNN